MEALCDGSIQHTECNAATLWHQGSALLSLRQREILSHVWVGNVRILII